MEKVNLEEQVNRVLELADNKASEIVTSNEITSAGYIKFDAYSVTLDGEYTIDDLAKLATILKSVTSEVKKIYTDGRVTRIADHRPQLWITR